MNWLNYHHLRYFWTVAKEGSLARAASRLNISQPSISEQIRELEESLGEKLFQKSGRRNVLTDTGRVAYDYADAIFALGSELMGAVKQQPGTAVRRFHVGIADSFPKLMTNRILKPVFEMPQPAHVICREGKMDELLAQLAIHRLDLVLSDEPASTSTDFKTFSHSLGESGTTFCAAPALAVKLKRDFPRSLHEAPAVLPAENSALRRALETWFREQNITPRVLVECEDLALLKALAAEGKGVAAIPTVAFEEAEHQYGFHAVGRADDCKIGFYAITTERRIRHPAATLVTSKARSLFS